MPEAPQFRALRKELLRGGISPDYVERTVLELRDHYTDLRDDALESGCSLETAEHWALEALGEELEIADAVLEHPELRCWSARHPLAAACGRGFATAAVMPAVPFVYCACRGPSIMRWGLSVGLGAIVTATLLLGLEYLMPLR